MLEEDFSSPTLSSEGIAHVVPIGLEDARVIGIAPKSCGLQVHIVGRSFSGVAITFQRMIVPQTRYGLKLDFNPPVPQAAQAARRDTK